MYKSFRLIQEGKLENSGLFFEKNFPIDTNIEKLKERIEVIVGISKDEIEIDLCDSDGSFIMHLEDSEKLIKDYFDFSNVSQMTLKIISEKKSILEEFATCKDSKDSKHSKEGEVFEDDVDTRFVLPDEEYDKLKNTVRNFKKTNKLGNYSEIERSSNPETIVKRFFVNQRCVVKSPGKPDRNGVIRYIGIPDNTTEYRIGVEFDYNLGLHDGIFNGKHYFQCEPKKGSYILPEFVFPLESPKKKIEQDKKDENDDLEEF